MEKSLKEELKYLFESDAYRLEMDMKNIVKNFKINKYVISEIEWKEIIDNFNDRFEQLYSSFELNKIQSGLFANKIYFKRVLLDQLKEKISYYLIMSSKKNQRTKDILLKVDEMFRVYFYQHFIETMNKAELKKIANKFKGKKISKDHLELYKNIFIKNDEYIENDGEGNFSKAVRVVMKNSSNWRNKFKSFNTFKNRNKIFTYKDYINYLSTIRK